MGVQLKVIGSPVMHAELSVKITYIYLSLSRDPEHCGYTVGLNVYVVLLIGRGGQIVRKPGLGREQSLGVSICYFYHRLFYLFSN